MTPEQQRIAIAEACGITVVKRGEFYRVWTVFNAHSPCCASTGNHLPDYLNDLNAMHEAEKTLTGDDRSKYYDYLALDCPWPDNRAESQWAIQWHCCRASALQRAKAFLRAKGLWQE